MKKALRLLVDPYSSTTQKYPVYANVVRLPFVGYVISGDLVGALYAASLRRRPIPVEDVYVTAHLARDVGVSAPVHDARFSCGEMVVDDCDLAQVTPSLVTKRVNRNMINCFPDIG